MKPARRMKKNQTTSQETVDLSVSQAAASQGTKRPSSSPPPARIGHPRSYSSPLGSGVGGAAAAAEDGEDSDFAFDKMTSSEEEEEYEPGRGQVVEIAVKKRPKKKRAVEGRSGVSSAVATPARKPTEAGGGRGQSGRGRGAGRGRGRGRGRGSGKASNSSGTTPKKATKKVSKAEALESGDDFGEEAGAGNSRPAKRRSVVNKAVIRDIADSDDDDDEGNSTSSREQGDDSDWEFDGNGGGNKGRGNGRIQKEGDFNGAAGASKKGLRAVSLSLKEKRSGSVETMDEGLGDESDEDEDFLVDDGGKDEPGEGNSRGGAAAAKAAAAPVKEESVGSRGSGIDLTRVNDSSSLSISPPSTGSKKKSATAAAVAVAAGKEEKRSSKASGSATGTSSSPSVSADASTAAPASAPAAGGKGKGKAGKDTADKGKRKAKTGKRSVLSTAKPAKLAADVEVVLRRLRRLRNEMGRGGGSAGPGRVSDGEGSAADGEGDGDGDWDWDGKKAQTLLKLGLGGDVTEVREMDSAGVMDEIEKIIVETALSIIGGKGFGFRVPTRSSGNQKYVEKLDRIVLGDKVSQRNFVSTAMARKTAITTRVIQLVHQVLGKGIHITKRDMFYTDVKLFREQGESDTVLDDVACMVGCTRSCLNVVASDKGLVVGRVTFLEDGDLIDCTRMGVGGKAIPPYIDKITEVRSDADFILLVEKEAAYMRLAEDRFYQKYPCIVITAKGQPDVATRLFLKRLKRELNIPVMGLVDSDPYGLKILSVYMSGSKNMSYDSASLTTPDIKWLGVRPSDLDRYNIPEQCRLDMTDHDIKTGKELLQEDFIKKSDSWCRELELMIKSKKKAEIQSLSAFGFQYLTHTYLPQKLQNGDWV